MTIVEEIYKDDRDISETDLCTEILKHKNLNALDFWLLPQIPFDVWRRTYDYPVLLHYIKKNQPDFSTWMSQEGITDEHLLNGYLSGFFNNKPFTKAKKKYLLKASYKGRISFITLEDYDGKTSDLKAGEPITYEYIKEFISYYDWKFNLNSENFNFIKKIKRDYYPDTGDERISLYGNIELLKMGGIIPLKTISDIRLQIKYLEFINANSLNLNSELYYAAKSMIFNHSMIDNLIGSNLSMGGLHFRDCSIKNIQIRNSQISQWRFFTSYVTGNIIDSKLTTCDIYGGQFTPVFTNSEISDIEVHEKGLVCSKNFEKTYRTLSSSTKDSSNTQLSKKYKIAEFDFIKSKEKGFKRFRMTLDKLYWSYGQTPERLIWITLGTIIIFGLFYSFFPENFKGGYMTPPYCRILANSLYYSAVTFTTLGYGDIFPQGFMKLFAAIEAVFGAITLGFLVAGLARKD